MPVQCRRCTKWRSPHEFVGDTITGYCLQCYSDHCIQIAQIRGIDLCCECKLTFTQLRARNGGKLRMTMVPKDGIYQLLCHICNARFEQLSKHFFKGTPYGKAQNLH